MKGLDDDINVATVNQHGLVSVYGRKYEGTRELLYTKGFKHYGAAKLWADEYEDAQRRERPVARR